MTDAASLTLIAAVFLLAGAVKGVIGLGLPTVSLGLLAAAFDLPTAMALLIVPSLVTNAFQASLGEHARAILVRLWPFLLMAGATVWVGAAALPQANPDMLSGLLGCLLMVYAAISLAGIRIHIAAQREIWLGPLFGVINGILTGMTGSFVVPGVLYLQAIGLSRDMLVQAMGMLFSVSTVALALALHGYQLLTPADGFVSAMALAPALIGMALGRAVRQRLSESRFRQVFFTALLLLGGYIVLTAALPGNA